MGSTDCDESNHVNNGLYVQQFIEISMPGEENDLMYKNTFIGNNLKQKDRGFCRNILIMNKQNITDESCRFCEINLITLICPLKQEYTFLIYTRKCMMSHTLPHGIAITNDQTLNIMLFIMNNAFSEQQVKRF